MTATAVAVTKVAASHARSVIAVQTVVDMLIVHLHVVDLANALAVVSVSAQVVVIVQASVNEPAVVLPIVVRHVAVHLATVLTAHRATTALLIVKHSKMRVTTHVASLHLHRTVSLNVLNAHRVQILMRLVVISVHLVVVRLLHLQHSARISVPHRVTIHRVRTLVHHAQHTLAHVQP